MAMITNQEQRLTVDTNNLKEMLGCGRNTAIKIGIAAGAKVKFGRRTVWNVSKVQRYIDSITETPLKLVRGGESL